MNMKKAREEHTVHYLRSGEHAEVSASNGANYAVFLSAVSKETGSVRSAPSD